MTRALLRFLKGRREQKNILHSAKILLLATVIFAVGCYETDFEVIDASSAVAVNGVTGTFYGESGGTMTISAVPHSNDYRFREVSKKIRSRQAISERSPYRALSISSRPSMTMNPSTILTSMNLPSTQAAPIMRQWNPM